MRKALALWLNKIWYAHVPAPIWLRLLALLYRGLIKVRRFLYDSGVLKSQRLPVPVLVVGNLTVGGTGKTPLIIALAQALKEHGLQPGIISRGYGGRAKRWPQDVDSGSSAQDVGDEPVLIARRSGCPVVVGPKRVKAAQVLLARYACDVILSDDGLQHYRLARDIEIVVVDGEKRFGNGYGLPAGPLREPVTRLAQVDLVIINGGVATANQFTMCLEGEQAFNLVTGATLALTAFAGRRCHALAGIGNPERFFKLLNSAGIDAQTHVYPDHYPLQAADICFSDYCPVLMTEKDAVKCTGFANANHWYVPVTAKLPPNLLVQLFNLLRDKHYGQKTT